jgi:uncharacterized protein YqeY
MNRCIASAGVAVLLAAAGAPVSAQAPSAGSADQQMLQQVANLNQGIGLLAHETMHRAGTFPSKTDAQSVDKQHDDQMDHIRAALTMLNDSYVAKASHADSARASALTKQSGAAYDSTFRADVAQLDQQAIQTIDKYTPQLTNAQVKTMAGRMKAADAAEAKKLGGGAGA